MKAYFTPACPRFLAGLATHNTREWFQEHKETFKDEVEKPFIELVGDLIEALKEYDPRIQITAKEAVFRIYRDTRFSKDKTPYKEHVSALVSPNGRKDHSHPGFYFEILASGIRMYSGVYEPEPAQLKNIRYYLAGHLAEFKAVYSDPVFEKRFGSLLGEKSKVLPADLKAAALEEPQLYNKNFYVVCERPKSLITDAGLLKELVQCWLDARRLNAFFEKALKET
ncbi:MAG TPA: DUF2461 domain-containing protein [Saprospiraceae bacterium]|nr:DUF2461 domain-containing protein [Saprospiraceae bacterium]